MQDPWMALLYRSPEIPATQFAKSNTTLYHWALANGYYTPLIEREKKWTMCSNSAFRKTLEGIRWVVWQDRNFCHGVFHDGFLVAPKEWPEQVRAAWGLKEPPTPYEAACAMLIEPSRGFWQLAKGANRLEMSVTYWWLAGLSEPSIRQLLGGSQALVSKGLYGLMSNFIRHAMTKKRFAVWALGCDLRPACTSRHVSRVALALLEGKSMRRAGGVNGGSSYADKAALKKLVEHPYIDGQLKSGARHTRIDRPLYKDGVVWPTLESKLLWLRENKLGGERVIGGRKILMQYKDQHPSWLKMTHV